MFNFLITIHKEIELRVQEFNIITHFFNIQKYFLIHNQSEK